MGDPRKANKILNNVDVSSLNRSKGMPKYIVETKETRTHVYHVEADDQEDAWEAVQNGEVESVSDQFDSQELHGMTPEPSSADAVVITASETK